MITAIGTDLFGYLQSEVSEVWEFGHEVWDFRVVVSKCHIVGLQNLSPCFFFKLGSQAQMRCSAEDNHNMVYMHVWKAAGYSVMENLKAIGSNYEAGPPASTIFSSKNGRTTSIHQFFFKLWFFDGEKKGSTSWMRNSDVFLGGGFLWGWLQLVWKHQPGAAAVGPGASVGTLLWGQNPWHTGWIDDPTMMFRLLVKCVWYHW